MIKDYCIFILTYERPKRQHTLRILEKYNIEAEIFLICSDDDKTLKEYQNLYKEKVVVFNKQKALKETKTDLMNNEQNYNIVLYARNYSFKIAKDLGYRYFLMLDDDYLNFSLADFSQRKWKPIKDLNKLFDSCFEFLKIDKRLVTFALAQGGDFIGGFENKEIQKVKRKVMNSFFIDTERPFLFKGEINEDTNFYISLTNGFCFQLHNVKLSQKMTQINSGGLTNIYKDKGTYYKSFYSLMLQPSAVTIKLIGTNFRRLHHNIKFNKICPKILSPKYKK